MRSVWWDRVRATEAHGASATLEPSASTGTPPHWEGGGSRLEKRTPAVSAWATTTSAGRWPQGCRHTGTNKADQGKGPFSGRAHFKQKYCFMIIFDWRAHMWECMTQIQRLTDVSSRGTLEKWDQPEGYWWEKTFAEWRWNHLITLQGGVFSLPVPITIYC